MDSEVHLLDLTDDVLHKVADCLGLQDKCRLEGVSRRFRSVLLEPRVWTELEAVLTSDTFSWLHRHVPLAQSLTLKSPLALQSDAAASFEDDVRALCCRADAARSLRLWGPQVALAQLPRQLESLKLDCWRYRNEDVQMLSRLSRLRSLTIHFLGEHQVSCLSGLKHLQHLQLVSLDYPATAGYHDLHCQLQPLSSLTSLKSLMLQELACPLPGNLPQWCDLSLDLSIDEIKRSALPRYGNLIALALFGICPGVEVDLSVLAPCTRLERLTLKSCRNVSYIPPLPALQSLRVVSYGSLCMHFPPAGLPQLQDLRLFAQSLTSNLDYAGSAVSTLAASLSSVCIATQQSAAAVVLCQQLRQRNKALQHRHVAMQCSGRQQRQQPLARSRSQGSMPQPQAAEGSAAGQSAAQWTLLMSSPEMEAWARAQHLSTCRIFATYAAAQADAGAAAGT